jgi:regulator of ribonuclease activity B
VTWVIIALVALMIVSVVRIVMGVRGAVKKKDVDDWDARFITQLRRAGVSAFELHDVDFFLELPTEAACDAVTPLLEADGFTVDRRKLDVDAAIAAAQAVLDDRPQREPPVPAVGEGAPVDAAAPEFSLHARKKLRLLVPDMQALSKRFNELAVQYGGRYDGWAVAR